MKTMTDEKDYLKATEFAKAVGVSRATLSRWDKTGLLKPRHHTMGGHKRYTPDQINDVLQHHMTDDT